MADWIPIVTAATALIGALGGVLLSNALSRRSQREEDRRRRLEHALRCVALAIAARNFATSAGMSGRPDSVTDGDVLELQRRIYLGNIERLFTTLREAREAIAVLVADGIDVPEWWREDEVMQRQLDEVYTWLRGHLAE